ncbi:MAG: hypothetical protein JXR91_06085 [Deltaproteobacteria bacterium]|nr:hypothetical protein [Deltaproteobacteria bacterium]
MSKKNINYIIIPMLLFLNTACSKDDIKTVDSDTFIDTETDSNTEFGSDDSDTLLHCGDNICNDEISEDIDGKWVLTQICCTPKLQCGYKIELSDILKNYNYPDCIDYTYQEGELSSQCPDSPIFNELLDQFQNQYKGCLTKDGHCGYWFDVINIVNSEDSFDKIYQYNLGCLDTEEFVTP